MRYFMKYADKLIDTPKISVVPFYIRNLLEFVTDEVDIEPAQTSGVETGNNFDSLADSLINQYKNSEDYSQIYSNSDKHAMYFHIPGSRNSAIQINRTEDCIEVKRVSIDDILNKLKNSDIFLNEVMEDAGQLRGYRVYQDRVKQMKRCNG